MHIPLPSGAQRDLSVTTTISRKISKLRRHKRSERKSDRWEEKGRKEGERVEKERRSERDREIWPWSLLQPLLCVPVSCRQCHWDRTFKICSSSLLLGPGGGIKPDPLDSFWGVGFMQRSLRNRADCAPLFLLVLLLAGWLFIVVYATKRGGC